MCAKPPPQFLNKKKSKGDFFGVRLGPRGFLVKDLGFFLVAVGASMVQLQCLHWALVVRAFH